MFSSWAAEVCTGERRMAMAYRKQVLYFKSCPRCQGDLYVNWDYYGVFKLCLQCGYIVDLARQAEEKVTTPSKVESEAA